MTTPRPVTVEHPAALTPDRAEALPFGQAHWWLRLDGGDFVKLGKKVRGDVAFKQVLSLMPGNYVLGVGPPREGVRVSLVVDASTPAPKKEEKKPAAKSAAATLELTGKSVVITGDLAAYDRDGATAWLEGLGALVKGSVSKKTDYVIVGSAPGMTKLTRATELGIPQLTEAQLREKLGLEAASAAPPAATAAAAPARTARTGSGKDKAARLLEELKPSAALLLTSQRHFIPPAAAPADHREASRYESVWE